MWVLQIQVAPKPDWTAPFASYWITSQCISLGRPPKKPTDTTVDIVIAGDSAVSKVHAELHQQNGVLSIKDLGRYGTFVNDQKMAPESTRQLHEGDLVKLATKVFIRVHRQPMVLCLSPGGPTFREAMQQAAVLGATVVEHWAEGVTHVLSENGQEASSVLARALLSGIPIVRLGWLKALVQQKVWTEIPSELDYELELLAAPAEQGATQAMSQQYTEGVGVSWKQLSSCLSGLAEKETLLQDLNVLFVNSYQDECLEFCLSALGASVLGSEAEAACVGPAGMQALAVSAADSFVHQLAGAGPLLPHMPASEILACILTTDVSLIQQRMLNAALLTGAGGQKSEQARMDDSDVTEDEDVEMLPGMTPAVLPDAVPPEAVLHEGAGRINHAQNVHGSTVMTSTENRQRRRAVQPLHTQHAGSQSNDENQPAGEGEGQWELPVSDSADASQPATFHKHRQGKQDFGPAPTRTLDIGLLQQQWEKHGPGTHEQDGTEAAAAGPGSRRGPAGGQAAAPPKGAAAASSSRVAAAALGLPRTEALAAEALSANGGPHETVGPGHAVLYLPLVVAEPHDWQDNGAAVQPDYAVPESVPNFKRFRKSTGHAAASFQAAPLATSVMQMVIESNAPSVGAAAQALLRNEKRRLDELFEGKVQQAAKRKR